MGISLRLGVIFLTPRLLIVELVKCQLTSISEGAAIVLTSTCVSLSHSILRPVDVLER